MSKVEKVGFGMNIIEVKEKELFDSLVNGIKEIFPVKKPRASYNMNIGVNRVKLEIEFYFYEDIKTREVSRYVYLIDTKDYDNQHILKYSKFRGEEYYDSVITDDTQNELIRINDKFIEMGLRV